MRPRFILLLLCLTSMFIQASQAQSDTIFTDVFNNDILAGWTVNSSSNMTRWRYTPDGKASQGQYWADRPAIGSPSGNGALMFDSDGQHFPLGQVPFPDTAVITSDLIDCSNNDEVWLEFYQYYRNALSTTTVSVSNDGGETWTDWTINQEIGFGVETPNNSKVSLNISSVAASESDVRIRFTFEGVYYFWIIDDVRLIEPGPNAPNFPRTFPPELGDSLTAWNIPYLIDSLGGAYPPTELVVRWVPGLTEAEKQDARDALNVVQYDTCNCSELEVFVFANTITLADSVNMIKNGDFSEGDAGFTSELSPSCNCGHTSYCVSTQFADKCVSFEPMDFEEFSNPGVGQFMIVDGPATGSMDVWCQNQVLSNNEEYIFAFRARTGTNDTPLQFQLYIDGVAVTPSNLTVNSAGTWTTYSFTFTYGGSDGMYDVCLRQENSGSLGFDYGLDDIFMANLDLSAYTFQDSIESKQESADAMPGKIEESDFNYYNFDIEELQDTTPVVNTPFVDNKGIEEGQENDLLIAILDTGIDYNYTNPTPIGSFDINPYMWLDPDPVTCYEKDQSGWNFVHKQDPSKRSKPFDDHSHGSHVAGILIQEWEQFRANSTIDGCCRLKLLPVKTHDFHGLGKLFDVSCGIVYATEMGAQVINASWGFTAVQDPDGGILHNVIEAANSNGNHVMIVTSAGNSGVDINSPMGAPTTPNYPSNYNLDNIITVAALGEGNSRWGSSNYSADKVHIAAPGESIGSIIPPGTNLANPSAVWATKSGTSMASPVVAAYAGALKCMDNITNVNLLKATLLNLGVDMGSEWDTWSISQKRVDLSTFINGIDFSECVVGTDQPLSTEAALNLFPNPAGNLVRVTVTDNDVPIRGIALINPLGQWVWQEVLSNNTGVLDQEINLQAIPAGMYYLNLYTHNGVRTMPLVKRE